MRLLAVHPGPLMYTKIYLRLEPLGLELVAAAARKAGHQVQLIDLQAETHEDYAKLVDHWQPDVVAFSCNYLANVPEIIDLSKLTRAKRPHTFVLVGGHSASFIAQELLEHAGGAIDCVVKGEGEASVAQLLEAVEHDRRSVTQVAGVVTLDGEGPPARLVENLDELVPARDLLRHRRRYFLGTLDDKIELNRRMNETLEAMARALFKSWFVDFDPVRAKAEGRDPGLPRSVADLFPDRFEDSELGEIPAGWDVGSVDDEFDLTMGQSPPGETYNEAGEGLPFYQGRADFGFRFPTLRVY